MYSPEAWRTQSPPGASTEIPPKVHPSFTNQSSRPRMRSHSTRWMAFASTCGACVMVVSVFGWFQSMKSTPTAPSINAELEAELNANKAWIEEMVKTDYHPNVTGSNSVGYLQKLWLNLGTSERHLAQQRLTNPKDVCNASNSTLETCLALRLGEVVYPLKWRALAGEKFALVSLEKPLKLTKDGHLDPASAETPDAPEFTLALVGIWELAINVANYEVAYHFVPDLAALQTAARNVADKRIVRLAQENRPDAAAELNRLQDWYSNLLEDHQKDAVLRETSPEK